MYGVFSTYGRLIGNHNQCRAYVLISAQVLCPCIINAAEIFFANSRCRATELSSYLQASMKPLVVQGQDVGKPRNPYYEKDIVYLFKPCKWIMKSIGIWPGLLKDSHKLLPQLAIGVCNVVLLFALIPFTLYLTLEEKNFTIAMSLVGLEVFFWLTMFKYWSLIASKPALKKCIRIVQDDWKEVERREERELMLKYGNMSRNVTILCVVLMYSGDFLYHTIAKYAIGTHIDEHNRTIKPLNYPAYSGLFDPQKRPYYDLVFVMHIFCGYIINSVTISVCGLAALFAAHVCGQIDIMILNLQNLADQGRRTDLNPRLAKIVEHHVRTLRFSSMIETLLQEACFFEFLGSTTLICLVEYYTILDWKNNNTVGLVTNIVILIAFMFNIFILCYIGDLLVEKTDNVGLLCFTIDWYHFPIETIRSLILIIGMSRFPSKISAGQIAVLDLTTFGNIIKSSLAYLSILRTTIG
ncbi:odorant receptor 85b-like [Megalopta genalis]|uniref:odorant receptor 85b-like n=1 Tax=Megalopta genalis TaxID=115081 RepID=UPI003FD5D8EC